MAKITCANFTEHTQCQGEGVHDYYLQVHDAFFKMCEAKPANIATLRVVPANIAALAVPLAAADLAECKREGIWDAEKFFKHQLFLAGLNEPIQGKVMEANKDMLHKAMRLAIELETIHQDRKRGQVAAIYEEDPWPPPTTKPTMISYHSLLVITESENMVTIGEQIEQNIVSMVISSR